MLFLLQLKNLQKKQKKELKASLQQSRNKSLLIIMFQKNGPIKIMSYFYHKATCLALFV